MFTLSYCLIMYVAGNVHTVSGTLTNVMYTHITIDLRYHMHSYIDHGPASRLVQ